MVRPRSQWSRRDFAFAAASTLTGPLAVGTSWAQASSQPVRIIVGFPPGGSSDVVARQLAEALRPRLNRVILVENKAGAGGRIAPEFVKSAPADGSVILLAPNPLITQYPSVYKKLAYDPVRDLAPLAKVASYPLFISVGPAVPDSVKTVRQYLDWAKSGPKNGFFASPATGSTPHFVGVMLGRASNSEFTHVPYKGDAPAIQDLLGGQVPMSINVPAAQLPHIASGKLRVLATTGPQRSPDLPGIPTIAEQGFEALQTHDWFGLFIPAATPTAPAQQLQAAVREALEEPALRESFRKLGVQPAFVKGDDFARQIREETVSFAALVKSVGFVPEE